MPPRRGRELGTLGTAIFVSMLVVLLASPGLVWWPLSFILPFIIFCSGMVSKNRDQHLAGERRGESICDFARTFDCRLVDTWIIRAVYEQFYWTFPLRASDRFEEDLHIDPEDLHFGAVEIARRVGRTAIGSERNPFFGKVNTLCDLVMFLHHQPLLEASPTRLQS